MKRLLPLLALFAITGCETAAEKAASAVTEGDPNKGREEIREHGCITCHTIPGIPNADGLVAPPLQQIAKRTYIAGVIVNTPENMQRWLKDPPSVDPLTAMPNLGLSDDEIRDIASYLYTLK